MNIHRLIPVLAAALSLAAPISGQARDKDRHHGHDRHHDSGRHFSHNRHYGYHGNYRSYGYYPYRYGYSYWPGSYYNSYYGWPSIGFSYYSRPSTIYRGREVYGSYSNGLSADVQRELRRRGYYRGAIDGDIGPGSRAAIRGFQHDRGLRVTGRIDTALLRSLGIS